MLKLDRLVWAAGFSFTVCGVRVGIRVNDPAVLERLSECLPRGWQPSRSRIVDQLYSIVVGRSRSGSNIRHYYLLYVGPWLVARTMDLDEVFDSLESDLNSEIAIRARRRLFVHAGAVGWRGRAVVIAGSRLSGKTCLVAALVRGGAAYYSDEYAVFDSEGLIHPYPNRLSLRQENGERSIKCQVETLGGITATKPLRVGLIVLTHYRAGARWRPRPSSPGAAMLTLLHNAVLSPLKPEFALATLGKALRSATVLKSARGEAEDVAESLLNHLDRAATRTLLGKRAAVQH